MSVFFFFRVLHAIFSHMRAHAFVCSVTVARSSAMQASSSRRKERRWSTLPAVANYRLGVFDIAPSPHHCFRTTHSCAQSAYSSPTEPILSRSSRQRLGHLHSYFDGGWPVCQAVFPEPQSAVACRRVQRRDCAHEALPRLQSVAAGW